MPGVHLVTHGHTNCYVVEGDDGVTLVDAAYPATWSAVRQCLADVGRSACDIRGLVLTHGHFDHVGFASRLQRCHGVQVWAAAEDAHLLRHPYRYRPARPRLAYPPVHPRSLARPGRDGAGRRAAGARGCRRPPRRGPDGPRPAGPSRDRADARPHRRRERGAPARPRRRADRRRARHPRPVHRPAGPAGGRARGDERRRGSPSTRSTPWPRSTSPPSCPDTASRGWREPGGRRRRRAAGVA